MWEQAIHGLVPAMSHLQFVNLLLGTSLPRSRRRQLGPSVHAVGPIPMQKKGLSHSESNVFMPRGSLQAQAAPLPWLPGKDIPARTHSASPAAFPLARAPWLATTTHPKAGRGNKPTWNWDKLALKHHTESPRALSACSSSVSYSQPMHC